MSDPRIAEILRLLSLLIKDRQDESSQLLQQRDDLDRIVNQLNWLVEQRSLQPVDQAELESQRGTSIHHLEANKRGAHPPKAAQRQQAMIEGLRAVLALANELMSCPDVDSTLRQAVESARTALGLERCGIFFEREGILHGTYGTDSEGQTTDEHQLHIAVGDEWQPIVASLKPREAQWFVLDNTAQTKWDGQKQVPVGVGWIVVTLIPFADGSRAFLFNDSAMTKMPVDEMQQEIVAVYCSLLSKIIERKKAAGALRQSEQDAREFQEKLKALQKIGLELAAAASVEELCSKAIEFGRHRLGYDRLGLLIFDDPEQSKVKKFGINAKGELFTESEGYNNKNDGFVRRLLTDPDFCLVNEAAALRDASNEIVGQGWNIMSGIWDGAVSIGWLAADNFLEKKSLVPYQVELLKLYSLALGHLITRKRIEQALRESEFFLKKSQTVARVGSFYLDVRTRQWIDSPMLDEIFGIDKDFSKDIEGWMSLVHPDQRTEIRGYFYQHVLMEHHHFDKEYRIIRHSDQQERWVYGLGELEFDDQGNVIKMIGTVQDITERKYTKAALQESEQRFSKIFYSSPIGISVSRLADGVIVDINDAALNILGFKREELIGQPHRKLSSWGGPSQQVRMDQEFHEKGRVRNYELAFLAKSGEPHTVLISIESIELGGQPYLLSSSLDITDRKRMEEALRESETRLSLVFNNTSWIEEKDRA